MTPPGTGTVTAHVGRYMTSGTQLWCPEAVWNSPDRAGCCCAQMWWCSVTRYVAYLREIGHPDSYVKPNFQNVIAE